MGGEEDGDAQSSDSAGSVMSHVVLHIARVTEAKDSIGEACQRAGWQALAQKGAPEATHVVGCFTLWQYGRIGAVAAHCSFGGNRPIQMCSPVVCCSCAVGCPARTCPVVDVTNTAKRSVGS
jgi:hypothetical protein